MIFFLFLAERKVHQASGHAAQFAEDRFVNVSQQFPSLLSRETPRSQGYSGPTHQYHILPYESECLTCPEVVHICPHLSTCPISGPRTTKSSESQHGRQGLCQGVPSLNLSVPLWKLLRALQQGVPGGSRGGQEGQHRHWTKVHITHLTSVHTCLYMDLDLQAGRPGILAQADRPHHFRGGGGQNLLRPGAQPVPSGAQHWPG